MTESKDKQKKEKAAALRYDPRKDNAPRLLAKGKGETARKIIDFAEKNDIHIEEKKDLVEILSQLEIGREVPPELYQVLAEILSFVLTLEDMQKS